MRSVAGLDVLVECGELLDDIVVELAESDKVDGYAVLLHLLSELDEGLLVFDDGGAGEDDNALALGFVLAVLEGEL